MVSDEMESRLFTADIIICQKIFLSIVGNLVPRQG